ncbi:MAG: hypothetical protein WBP79_02095, partial [Candidatus Acidiferrales bacterium]
MSKTFDIGIESLAAGKGSSALCSIVSVPHASAQPAASAGKSFYIETFGCQMNVHDSEKVSGVLLGRGYRSVETPAEADVVLYNTCSIREKAAQKVFARLG